MMARLTRSFVLRALVTAAVLALLLVRIDLGDAARAISRLDPGAAFIVLLLLAVDRSVMIWRWVVLLRATGQPISAASATRIHLVSSFVAGFLPTGASDVARAYALTQRTSQGGAAVASVAADRLLGLVSIVLVAVVGVGVWRGDAVARSVLLSGALACIAASAAVLWADRWIRAVLPDPVVRHRFGTRVLRYADALSAYRGHRGAMLFVLLLSAGVQLLRILQAYVLGRGIDIDVPLEYYLVFMPLGLIALLLPISISGFGAPQAIMVWLLRPLGVPDADAFALTTLIVLTGLAGNLPGALLYLRSRERR